MTSHFGGKLHFQMALTGSAVLDVELTGYSLADNGISGLEDITEVELTIEVKSGSYKTAAKPVVAFSINQ